MNNLNKNDEVQKSINTEFNNKHLWVKAGLNFSYAITTKLDLSLQANFAAGSITMYETFVIPKRHLAKLVYNLYFPVGVLYKFG